MVFCLDVLDAPLVFGLKSWFSTDCVAAFSLREAVAEFPSWWIGMFGVEL